MISPLRLFAPVRFLVLASAFTFAPAVVHAAPAKAKPPAKAQPAKADAAKDTAKPATPAAETPPPAPAAEQPVLSTAGSREKFDVGEVAPTFALRAVNPEVIGENLVAVDRYFGADAKQPKKAVLISFFATWCEPCKKEMPFLAALYDTYKDKGVMVLSISIDREAEQIDFIKTLATNANAKYPVLSDRFNIVAKRYMVAKLPLVYVMSPDGKVAFSRVGYTEDTPRALADEIRKLIGESGAPMPDTLSRFLGNGQAVADAKSGTGDATVATATVNKTTTVAGQTAAAGDDKTVKTDGDAATKGKKAKGKAKGKKGR
jgi:alkyl hydroperoxide reductase subunit AhpC